MDKGQTDAYADVIRTAVPQLLPRGQAGIVLHMGSAMGLLPLLSMEVRPIAFNFTRFQRQASNAELPTSLQASDLTASSEPIASLRPYCKRAFHFSRALRRTARIRP